MPDGNCATVEPAHSGLKLGQRPARRSVAVIMASTPRLRVLSGMLSLLPSFPSLPFLLPHVPLPRQQAVQKKSFEPTAAISTGLHLFSHSSLSLSFDFASSQTSLPTSSTTQHHTFVSLYLSFFAVCARFETIPYARQCLICPQSWPILTIVL